MPLFGEAISKADYESLIAKIKAHLEANAMKLWLIYCAMCAPCCVGLCYVYPKASALTRELGKIGEDFDGACVELVQISYPTGFGNQQAYDQYGQPLMTMMGGTQHRAGEMKPCWPPLGYNIILKAPRSFDLRNVWPGVSQQQSAAGLQIPAQVSMGPPAGAPAGAAAGAAAFCSQCGVHLEAGGKFCIKCGAASSAGPAR